MSVKCQDHQPGGRALSKVHITASLSQKQPFLDRRKLTPGENLRSVRCLTNRP